MRSDYRLLFKGQAFGYFVRVGNISFSINQAFLEAEKTLQSISFPSDDPKCVVE